MGLHDGVLRTVEVLRRVFVGGAVAAADVAADEAHAEVDPSATDFETVFAALGGGLHVLDLVEVMTLHGGFLARGEMRAM